MDPAVTVFKTGRKHARGAGRYSAFGTALPRQRDAQSNSATTDERDAVAVVRQQTEAPASVSSRDAFVLWWRTHGFKAEVVTSLTCGLVFAAVAPEATPFVLFALAVWVISAFHKGRTVTSPLSRQLRVAAQSIIVSLAACSMAVAFLGLPQHALADATFAVLAAGSTSCMLRALRWRLQSPVRVLLVGDRDGIAEAASRWLDQKKRVSLVAAVLVEPDLDEVPSDILGIPTVTGLAAAPAIVEKFKANLVVVSPGASFTNLDFRRLAWALEQTEANLGVLGVLDSVAPHRITPGWMHGATVSDVRLPRPSVFVHGVKAALDRVAAALLLVAVSPLLLAMSVAVRLDSKGKAFFAQTRVGKHGRHFTLYKMRTMVEDAEHIKDELAGNNEYDGILFKMKDDPRVTRIGAALRRSSLDELPQLVNVVRGEMSLVGPRPSLPSEVEDMDSDTLRRLAVRPGITGLWQVSGRSDLSWKAATALDTYYADNWSLLGDAMICARTLKAVVKGDGAY